MPNQRVRFLADWDLAASWFLQPGMSKGSLQCVRVSRWCGLILSTILFNHRSFQGECEHSGMRLPHWFAEQLKSTVHNTLARCA